MPKKQRPEYVITWNAKTGEYVARVPLILNVSGHSRHPGFALTGLLKKLLELGFITEDDLS